MTDKQEQPGLDEALPEELRTRILGASARVEEAFGVKPDLTCDTLPLLDAYLRALGQELPTDERHAVLEELGCHFGEVLRRTLNGHWATISEGLPPSQWRIELESCFLYFYPVGMAAEVMLGCESEEHDGSFATSDDQHALLAEMLDQATPMSEEAYFSLSGRADVLLMVTDFLTGRRLMEAKGKPLEALREEDYAAHLAASAAN